MADFTGTANSETIDGTGDADTLRGVGGDDTINGLGGDDLVEGGEGADTLSGGDGYDTLSYENSDAAVVVNFLTLSVRGGHAQGDTIGAGGLNDFEAIVGSIYGDVLIGDASDNTIDDNGGTGDIVFAGDGADTLLLRGIDGTWSGDAGNDIFRVMASVDGGFIDGGDGLDILDLSMAGATGITVDLSAPNAIFTDVEIRSVEGVIGTTGNDTLLGTDDNNWLEGGDGNDLFQGGAGSDRIYGGAGTDTAIYSGNFSQYTLTETATGEYTLAGPDGTDYLFNVEFAQFDDQTVNLANPTTTIINGTDSGETLNGTAGNDTIFGYGGNDNIAGLAGEDYIDGGDGNDAVYGGSGADTIIGGTGFDELYGEDGADFIDGGDGSDDIFGGNGDDTILGGAGDDIIRAEDGNDLVYGGSGQDFISGGVGDDEIYGEGDNDTLIGSFGNDIIYGGDGDDDIRGVDDNDELYGEEGDDLIRAGTGDDLLYGGSGLDRLRGNEGNDLLDGGTGADDMQGGTGDDVYYVDDIGDVVTELANEGNDYVYTSVAIALPANVENMVLGAGVTTATGSGVGNRLEANIATATSLFGLAGNDVLVGSNFDDILDGGTGADSMTGGDGDDTYYVDNVDDFVGETADGGFDTVISSVNIDPSSRFFANIEAFVLTGTATSVIGGNSITGNDLANTLTTTSAFGESATVYGMGGADDIFASRNSDYISGGDGNDTIYAYSGNDEIYGDDGDDTVFAGGNADTVYGGEGNDDLQGGNGGDTLYGGGGSDFLKGQRGNDTLDGGDGSDDLRGNDGKDMLIGGAGADILAGGTGQDDFVFDEIDFDGTGLTGSTADRITDFSRGDGDLIDLSAVDAIFDTSDDDAFAFIGSDAFSGTAGELRYEFVDGYTMVFMDTDGDMMADFAIRVDGTLNLLATDFVL